MMMMMMMMMMIVKSSAFRGLSLSSSARENGTGVEVTLLSPLDEASHHYEA